MGIVETFRKIKHFFVKWKFVNKDKYKIIPGSQQIFTLTPSQKRACENICKRCGNIEYTFYPCEGIGYGVKIKIWKTGEYIDITDTSNW